jgi:hypothetical protein
MADCTALSLSGAALLGDTEPRLLEAFRWGVKALLGETEAFRRGVNVLLGEAGLDFKGEDDEV